MRYGALKTRIDKLEPEDEQETYVFADPEEAKKFEQKLIRERGEVGLENVLIIITPVVPLSSRHTVE